MLGQFRSHHERAATSTCERVSVLGLVGQLARGRLGMTCFPSPFSDWSLFSHEDCSIASLGFLFSAEESSLAAADETFSHDACKLGGPHRVAALVVVPGVYLDHVALHHLRGVGRGDGETYSRQSQPHTKRKGPRTTGGNRNQRPNHTPPPPRPRAK
eukprot:scaffold28205_cov197-Isochrysis_galbana.AAC.2